ncbi:MAG TPA: amino acid adenylation domain-containing protein [Pyrinomonadaceae bacterium]|nr:amino acid adenylation domain-containing protein [Pyrinomonadaceae bacterium]
MIGQLQGFRVSPQQRHLWLVQEANSSAYHARCAALIEGELDVDALRMAVETVVQRHEILRTVFARTPGVKVPLQVVTEKAEFQWSETNPTFDGELEALAGDAWDYEHGPMVRVRLVCVSPDEHVLLVALPALCSDAVGLQNLVHEIARTLNGDSDDEFAQYVDLAEWQNELFESEDARTGRDFWINRSLNSSVPHRLPFEHQSERGFEPAVVKRTVSVEVSSQFLLACWQVLLWRYLEQPMIVGVGFDGRNYEELESSLGLFAKYLPLQFDLRSNTRFSDLVDQTTRSIEQIAQWQESFTWDAQTQYFPFCFDTVNIRDSHTIGNISIAILKTHTCIDRFNLKLCAVNNTDLEFHYDSSRFEANDVDRLADQFLELLTSAIAQPDAPISRLNLFNSPELLPPITRDIPAGYVHQLFEQQATSTPDAVAVEFGEQSWTYAELNARANQVAAHLRKLGAGPETVVAIRMERSLELMASILGTLKAGAAYLPLDPSYPEARLAFMLEQAKPIVVLTRDNIREILANDYATTNVATEISGKNIAYVIYTSGSTGEPKGVMIPHEGLTNYIRWSLDQYSVTEGDAVPLHSPLTFDLTVTTLFAPLLAGRKVVLISEDHIVDSLAKGSGFSFVKLTPAHLEALNQLLPPARAAEYARALIIGGEALYGENCEFWKRNAPETRIINEYGPTETVVGCCVYNIPAADVEPGPVSIGHSISNMEVYLLNSEFQPVPVGITGEIFIGGVALARGYLNRPDLTADRFVPSPFRAGERLYRTGDLGRYQKDGSIQFAGRCDHQVKLRGYRIELGEIESVLTGHPSVSEAAAVLSEDTTGERRLVAYVVGTASETELRDYVTAKLPDYMVPSAFVTLDRLPLTAHGKVDRNQLPAPETIGRTATYVAPRTPTEETLAAMWSEVLNVENVGVDDNFFDLGGHSLLATRIIARANQTFQIELPMHKLLEMPTVAGLASVVDESLMETARVLAELEQLTDEEAEALLAARNA